MFWKSLQLKLILVFMILIVTIILGIGAFSIIKIEEVYYIGFVDEMLNNIAGYNFNVSGLANKNDNIPFLIYGPPKQTKVKLEEFYNNFRILCNITNTWRTFSTSQ